VTEAGRAADIEEQGACGRIGKISKEAGLHKSIAPMLWVMALFLRLNGYLRLDSGLDGTMIPVGTR
jgi:hypothetical protein